MRNDNKKDFHKGLSCPWNIDLKKQHLTSFWHAIQVCSSTYRTSKQIETNDQLSKGTPTSDCDNNCAMTIADHDHQTCRRTLPEMVLFSRRGKNGFHMAKCENEIDWLDV